MTYVVGDIHGCLRELEILIDKINPSSEDKLVFLGDYVDRGPDSKGVIDYLINLSKRVKTVFLRGNHEAMLIDCVKYKKDCTLWSYNGSSATLRSFNGVKGILEKLEFFENTKYYHIHGRYFIVHGGVKPGVPIENQDPFDMIWIRDEFIFSNNPLPGYVVVFGHTPFEKPLLMKDKIGIDTGCVYGGYLTAVRLEDLKIFQVKCGGGWVL